MASDLYETLEISKDASPEEVRRAYKKLALKTHPDRQPKDATEAQIQEANDSFRKVNNAYEVLNDPTKRADYDRAGVWPPTSTEETTRPSRSRTYPTAFPDDEWGNEFTSAWGSDPFGSRNRPRAGAQAHFTFTDPFVLFNSLFPDMQAQFNQPFFNDPAPFGSASFAAGAARSSARDRDPFAGTPFARNADMNSFFSTGPSNFDEALAQFHGGDMGDMGTFTSSSTSRTFGSSSTPRGGQSWSKSVVTRTINGRTETVTTERDANGNERVTYSSPEGERHTVNGVEQPRGSQGRLPVPPTHRHTVDSRVTRSTRESRIIPESSGHRSGDSASSSSHARRGTAQEYYNQPLESRSSRSSHSHRQDSAPVVPYVVPRSPTDRELPRRGETDRPREDEDRHHHHSSRRSHTISTSRQETYDPFNGVSGSSSHGKKWWKWQG